MYPEHDKPRRPSPHGYGNTLAKEVQDTALKPAPPLETEASLDLCVLIAEDGIDNQRVFTFFLEQAGARVEVVDDGAQAVERLAPGAPNRDRFDIILMDMDMPVMDGYQAAAKLRSVGCRVPIIALTAHALSGDRTKCLAAGCDDYIAKPVDRKVLIAKCRALAEHRRSRAAAA